MSMCPACEWVPGGVEFMVVREYIMHSADTTSCKISNFFRRKVLLFMPGDYASTHFIRDLRCHER